MNKPFVRYSSLINNNWTNHTPGKCNILFGIDAVGLTVVDDLNTLGTVFIAGTTGSGKSLFLETCILSIMENYPTNKVSFLLMDTKEVQLPAYNLLPNLACPVVNDPKDALNILTYLTSTVKEKDFPTILLIDDFYDLIQVNAELTHKVIVQLIKHKNLHVILSTSSPCVYRGIGSIQPNTAVAFRVTESADSECILGIKGAEKLKGKGQMMLKRPNNQNILKVQAPFISSEDINARLQRFAAQSLPTFDPALLKLISPRTKKIETDTLLEEAITILRFNKLSTVGDIQRKLQVGYARAAKLLEQAKTEAQEVK